MTLMLAAGAVQAQAVVFENEYVRVARDDAPCASAAVPGCRDRVIVALGDVELRSRSARRVLTRGDVAVFRAGESYQSLAGGAYFEVALKPNRPPVESPVELIPPDKNAMLYDGEGFFVFEERLAVGDIRLRHSHSQRVVIQLNRTRLHQWPEGQPEIIRDIEPDRVAFNPPVIHKVQNVGDLPLRGIVIEFKAQSRTPLQDSVKHLQPDVSLPIVGGFVGAVAGAAVGGIMIGVPVLEEYGDPLTAVLVFPLAVAAGIVVGEPWGAACGVHIGNGRHGNPLPAILASVAVAAGGVGAAFAADDWRVLLAVPVVQVAVAVPIERSTARGTVGRSRWCRL